MYRRGGKYKYFGVTGKTFRALVQDESIGSALQRLILTTNTPYEKIG